MKTLETPTPNTQTISDRGEETILIGRRKYRKFIPYPQPVTDGTVRCAFCGQIDEPEYHDNSRCLALSPASGVGGKPLFSCSSEPAAGLQAPDSASGEGR